MRPANGVNPRRLCIVRRESYGRRAGPRRDPAARGSVRPIPDHTSAAGPAAETRVESIRTFFRFAFQVFLRTGADRVRPEPFVPNDRSESPFSRYVQKKEFSPAARFTRFRLNI